MVTSGSSDLVQMSMSGCSAASAGRPVKTNAENTATASRMAASVPKTTPTLALVARWRVWVHAPWPASPPEQFDQPLPGQFATQQQHERVGELVEHRFRRDPHLIDAEEVAGDRQRKQSA